MECILCNNKEQYCNQLCSSCYHKNYRKLHKKELQIKAHNYYANLTPKQKKIHRIKAMLSTLKNIDKRKKYLKEYYKRDYVKKRMNAYTKTKQYKLNQKKYRNSLKGFLFFNSEKRKVYRKIYNRKWSKSLKAKEMKKKWLQTPKGKMLNYRRNLKRRVRLRKAKLIKTHTLNEWTNILQKSNGVCAICKKFVGINNLTKDHIIPISSPFEVDDGINNIQPVCGKCNSSKAGWKY